MAILRVPTPRLAEIGAEIAEQEASLAACRIDNRTTKLKGPLGEGAQWRGNIVNALCDWYDTRDDNDTTLAGPGDHFAENDIYAMWHDLRRMYVDADKYGGKFEDPGLWFCDYVDYYLNVRKPASVIGQNEHVELESEIRDLIFKEALIYSHGRAKAPARSARIDQGFLNNNIACYLSPPSLFSWRAAARLGGSSHYTWGDEPQARRGTTMAISTTLKDYLDSNGFQYKTVAHSHTFTSMHSAEAAHISGESVAKAVVLAEGDDYLLAVVPATHRLQFGWIHRHLGHSAGLATEREIKKLFHDCEVGAVPACGEPFGLKVIVDDKLLELSEVCFESGDHEHLIRLSGDEFRKLTTGAESGAISRHV